MCDIFYFKTNKKSILITIKFFLNTFLISRIGFEPM